MLPEERQNLKFLRIQHEALAVLGLDIGRRKQILKQKGRLLFNFICTTYIQYGFINFVAHSMADFDRATSGLSIFNQGILLALKVMLIVLKGDGFLKLIWEMNTLAKEANSEEYDNWLLQNYHGELATKCYYYACVVCVVLAFTAPPILLAYEYSKGLESRLRMPFELLLPLDDDSLRFSIFVYVVLYFHIRALRNSSVGIDTLFGWYVAAVSGHFRILRIKIETMANKIALDNNHGEFVKDVASFVRYHNRTLKFLSDLNYIYGEILFSEITFSCLQICFHLYTMTNDRNADAKLFHLMAFSAITIQLMIYCFGGEKIKNENDMLFDDIYMKMPWEKMLPTEKKLMLLPLIKAQKEASLYGLFFILNRNLLVYIFKTAFSFVTLLGAMTE